MSWYVDLSTQRDRSNFAALEGDAEQMQENVARRRSIRSGCLFVIEIITKMVTMHRTRLFRVDGARSLFLQVDV